MTAYYLLLWQIPYTVGSLQLHIPVRKKKRIHDQQKISELLDSDI